jgi:mannose-6-phosphate isomerase
MQECLKNICGKIVQMYKFTTNILSLTATVERDITDLDSFVIYTCLEGDCRLSWEDQVVEIVKGDSLLVPALISNFSLSVSSGQSAKLLEVYIN